MPGIGIITNPHSKLNKRNPGTPQLLGYILGEHGRLAITQSLQDLSRVAYKFRDSNIDILAINGGDGTISKTLTAFVEAYGDKPLPKIALLRGGTMNVLANNLGISGSPPRILFRLCEAYSGDAPLRTERVSSLNVNGAYGFLYADGIAYNVLDEFYQNKTGPVGAALLVLKLGLATLFKTQMFYRLIKSQQVELKTDKRQHQHRSLSVMAASIERMPYGLRLFPAARAHRNEFQYFSVTAEPEKLLQRILPVVLLTQPKDYESKVGGLATSLSIKAHPGYTYSLDGELFRAETETVNLGKGPDIDFIII